jgi:hypothetical protein
MQKMTLLRFVLGSVVAATSTAGALAAGGCNGDNGSSAQNDAGNDTFVPPGDGGNDATNEAAPDTGGGEAEAGPPHAKVVLVHASPDLPALRFCFGIGVPDAGGFTIAPFPAAPHDDTASMAAGLPYPGAWPGTGGSLADYTDLSNITITAYAVDAAKIKAEVKSNSMEKKCPDLLGATGTGGTLTAGTDYWLLGSIPTGTLLAGSAWLGAVTGCLPGETTLGIYCGTGYSQATGNIGFKLAQLDNQTAVDAGMGGQFAQMSSAWDAVMKVQGGSGVSAAGFVALGADGGSTPYPIVTDAVFGDLKPTSVESAPVSPASDGFFIQALNADGGGVAISALPFSAIAQLTYGKNQPSGGAFNTGGAYVFVFVGNPLENEYVDPNDGGAKSPDAGGVFNTRFVHFLGFPTNPPFGGM